MRPIPILKKAHESSWNFGIFFHRKKFCSDPFFGHLKAAEKRNTGKNQAL